MLDPQLKRGLLDHCVLAALCRGDSYGYQIIKDLSGSVALSESTLYPILRRLEQRPQLLQCGAQRPPPEVLPPDPPGPAAASGLLREPGGTGPDLRFHSRECCR